MKYYEVDKTLFFLLLSSSSLSCRNNFAKAQEPLPPLPNDLCSLDEIYSEILTGNVHEYTMEVRWRTCPSNKGSQPCGIALNMSGFEFMSPGPVGDGVRSETIAINDDIPGPTIRASLGDTIRVTVVNHLSEPTTMHFHGMTQFRTPWSDGDPVSNCPIEAGYNYTYEFIAHPIGTTFYHSHEKSQRAAGMYGALIVEDPAERNFPEHTVLFTDHYHQNPDENFFFWGQNTPGAGCITFGGELFTGCLNPRAGVCRASGGVGPVVGDGKLFQSFTVNGRGVYNYEGTQIPTTILQSTGNETEQTFAEQACPGQTENPPQCEICLDPTDWSSDFCTTSSGESECGMLTVYEVRPGESTRLRLINGGTLFTGNVCIDGHAMRIIALDGSLVEPYTVECIILTPGERIDVIIDPTTEIGDYWMRFTTVEETAADGVPFYNSHQGWAIVRVMAEPGTPLPANYPYRSNKDPIPCDGNSITTNCGPDYWNTAITFGCAFGPVNDDPYRCRNIANLVASGSPNDDRNLCHAQGRLMAHEVTPNHQLTTGLNFLPDPVPRYQGNSFNTRIEVLREEDWGFPYFTPNDPDFWGTHEPISFISPAQPVLSASPEERDIVYNDVRIVREVDESNPGELPPSTAYGFSSIRVGVNNYQLQYGDVVRLVMTCAEPYGPGCAMAHPMHLHGHKYAVLFAGNWDDEYDESRFVQNPIYRDTIVAQTDGYNVIQFVANNPGVWRFHCHVTIHHRSGMAMVFDVGGNSAVEAVRQTPPRYDNCIIYQSSSQSLTFSGLLVAGLIGTIITTWLAM